MTYKMTHPASDLEIEANAEQVAMYESQGWETSPTAKPPTEGGSKK
jgi:hypothetical protein